MIFGSILQALFASLWPLMLDGFRLVLLGQSPRATPRKRSKGRLRSPLYGQEEEKRWFLTVGSVVATMWDGGCLYYPQVELVSPWFAFRWPWRQVGPLAVLGIRNARKAKERVGWLAVGLVWSRGPRRNNTTEGGQTGSRRLAVIPSVCCLRPLLLCLLLFSWFPSCRGRVSSCLCGHRTPRNPRSAKSPCKRALWRVLTRADLSSQ